MRSFRIDHRACSRTLAAARPTRASVAAAALLALACQATLASSAAGTSSAQPGAPRVSTGAGAAHGSTVELKGSINPRGEATTYYFKYGPTVTYGSQTPTASLPAGTTVVKVSQTVGGLQPGYHYRLVAMNGHGSKEGHDRTYSPKTKKKQNAFELPKTFAPTPLGGTFVLSGTLTGTGNANRAIVLQASPYPYSRPYANVGNPILTDAAGRFTFRVARLSVSTKYRVATVGLAPLYSPIVPAQVAVSVTLKARSSHTGLVRLYGTVTPAQTGARVFFQLEKPPKAEGRAKSERPAKLEKPGKGKSEKAEERAESPTFSTRFSATVKRGTNRISRFSAVVSIRDTGHYRAFVQVRQGPLVSGHSTSILLRAPAKTKSKRKS